MSTIFAANISDRYNVGLKRDQTTNH